MGSRKDTVSVPDSCFQSATVAPETWFTDTPSGIVNDDVARETLDDLDAHAHRDL